MLQNTYYWSSEVIGAKKGKLYMIQFLSIPNIVSNIEDKGMLSI